MRLLRILLTFTLLGFIGACHTDGTLRPFTTDGCSLFPDGTLKERNLWHQCCVEHDRAYWLGGTRDERAAADKLLRQCVEGLNHKNIARLMQDGVRAGGTPWLPTWFRWGFGWPLCLGYQALTDAEENEALRLMTATTESALPRPARWATPIVLSGAPNLHKVSDTLYRSAQPTAEGMRNLKALGIRTVINLRAFHSDRELLDATGLHGEHIYMKTWHPEQADVVRFLKLATDSAQAPVLVHCQHGADRTGTMVALYRMAVQGWSQEEATREMAEGGFGFHEIWINLIPWIEKQDINALRREAGITPPHTNTRK
ncbi:MAG: dual specificity protein phosphatase family protein [Gammaproteobacteria bacterium]|nr:dual specificity protein phosphatase family protein [Gammaproteobacteria bacterium]